MKRFDWAELMRAGLALGLKPRDFWGLTPAELAYLLRREASASPLTRAGLEELTASFPDMKGEEYGGT